MGELYIRPPSLGEQKVYPYGKNIHLIAYELISGSFVSSVLEISFSLN